MSNISSALAKITTLIVNGLAVALVIVAAVLGWNKRQTQDSASNFAATATANAMLTPTVDEQTQIQVDLPLIAADSSPQNTGISRTALMNTDIPSRPRVDVAL